MDARFLTRFFTTLLGVSVLQMLVGLMSLPAYVERVTTLTIEPFSFGVDVQFSNEIVAAQAAARGMSMSTYAWWNMALAVAFVALFGVVAALILWRANDGWFTRFSAAILIFLGGLPLTDPLRAARLLPDFWLVAPSLAWPLYLLYFFLFPNGRVVPLWARWPVGAVFVVHLLIQGLALVGFFVPGFTPPEVLVSSFFLVVVVFGFAQILLFQIYRYVRVSGFVERQQTRWFVAGLALLVATSFYNPLGPAYQEEWGLLSIAILPLTIGIAITRYRLFDIDVIIRRTLVYAVLTLTLGATYFSGVVALQWLFVRLTGQANTLAIVASTLVIAVLFGPLHRLVQAFIDRRFFRRKYDAQLVLAQFAARAQREADLDALSADLLATVDETLKPSEVRLWLVRSQEVRR